MNSQPLLWLIITSSSLRNQCLGFHQKANRPTLENGILASSDLLLL